LIRIDLFNRFFKRFIVSGLIVNCRFTVFVDRSFINRSSFVDVRTGFIV
jgi:hypothetical protein